MNKLIDDNYVTQMNYGANFSYVLNDNTSFLPTEYKVLQSRSSGIFLKCIKMFLNGKLQLFYPTESLIPLKSVLPELDPEGFRIIVMNVIEGVIETKANGFLRCQNIVLSSDHVFVDPITKNVKLVYLPVKHGLFQDVVSFENELRSEFAGILAETPGLSSKSTMYLASDLLNRAISLESVHSKISFEPSGNVGREESIPYPSQADRTLRLVTLNQPHLEILINKPEFVIGKKQSAVDGAILFNSAISRVHCKVICRGDRYCIEDLQSANGTFVNGEKLKPFVTKEIENGDIVRLANSDFRVELS